MLIASIFRTSHECDVTINDGTLMKNECQETHFFKPFSNENSGAVTIVTQTLSLVNDEKGYLESCNSDITSDLAFVHDHKRTDRNADESFVQEILDLHPNMENSELPGLFNKLVYSLRNLKHSQMVNIYFNIKNQRTKKFFEDALPLLKSDAGVSLMRDIIKSGQLSKEIVDSWFSSLAFYKNPSRAMLTVLSTFIDQDAPHSALLGISGLASTFCTSNKNCLEIAEMKEVVTKFELLLGTSCETETQEEEDSMVLVLKGLRNIGQIIDSKDVLNRCYQTKSNPMLVRVAVIETIRKWQLSCIFSENDDGLVELFKDKQEDSELRINAYLAMMTCPTEKIIDTIKILLMEEEVNQGKLQNSSVFCF